MGGPPAPEARRKGSAFPCPFLYPSTDSLSYAFNYYYSIWHLIPLSILFCGATPARRTLAPPTIREATAKLNGGRAATAKLNGGRVATRKLNGANYKLMGLQRNPCRYHGLYALS